MTTTLSLAAIESVIGPPDELIADGQQRPPSVRALWECGCEATGFRLTMLALAPCGEHEDDFTLS